MTTSRSAATAATAASLDTITINGVQYVRADSLPAAKPSGNRAVVIIDRGFIYAGDVLRENGRIKLSRCVWVFKWKSCGFDAVINDPKKAEIRPHADIDIPEGSEIFSVPVDANWGLA